MIKIIILLLLLAACNCAGGVGGFAPMAAERSRQSDVDWANRRQEAMDRQWQADIIRNQEQTDRQNREWKPSR